MTYTLVVTVVASLVPAGLLALWIALVVRRARALGRSAPFRERTWFVGVFGQGLILIRRCRWLLIIVARRVTISEAMRECLRLWSYQWRNAAAFLGICVLILLPLAIIGHCIPSLFFYASWTRQLLRLLLGLAQSALSALVACSMMVFVRTVGDGGPQRMALDTGDRQ